MATKASKLVAAAKEWAGHYGDYTQGEEAAAYTVALRVKGRWDANDADGIAEVFVDNGSLLAGDTQLVSRDEIRDYLKQAFTTYFAGTSLLIDPVEVKLLTPETAMVITNGGVVAAGESELESDQVVRGVWIAVKRDSVWHLVSYQTSPVKG
jgi:uncharacterized protein (TIGR02246 family)